MRNDECRICGEETGPSDGSHYHCGRCQHVRPTGMTGHYTDRCAVTANTRKWHMCCPGSCELQKADSPYVETI